MRLESVREQFNDQSWAKCVDQGEAVCQELPLSRYPCCCVHQTTALLKKTQPKCYKKSTVCWADGQRIARIRIQVTNTPPSQDITVVGSLGLIYPNAEELQELPGQSKGCRDPLKSFKNTVSEIQ